MAEGESKETPVPLPRGNPLSIHNHDYDNFTPLMKKPVPLPRHSTLLSTAAVNQENLDAREIPLSPDKSKSDTLEETITRGYSTISRSFKKTTDNVHEKSKAVFETTKNMSAKIEKSVKNIISKHVSITTQNLNTDSVKSDLSGDTSGERIRCQSLPSEDIFKSISFESPIIHSRIVDDSPPPPDFPPPPLPDESLYDEISTKSSHSGSYGDHHTSGRNFESESVYEEPSSLKQLRMFEESDSDSLFNIDSKVSEDVEVNVSRSGSWRFYDSVQNVSKTKPGLYENVVIGECLEKNYIDKKNIDTKNTKQSNSTKSDDKILLQNFQRSTSEVLQTDSCSSSLSVVNDLYCNVKRPSLDEFSNISLRKHPTASKSVIFEFDPLYNNMYPLTQSSLKKSTVSLPHFNDVSDDDNDDFDVASLPVPPTRFDSIHTELISRDIPNNMEDFVNHRLTSEVEVSHLHFSEKSILETADINHDSSTSESPNSELGDGNKKSSNLGKWINMKKAIKMVAEGSHWSPGANRRTSKKENLEKEMESSKDDEINIPERPEIALIPGSLHSGFIFKPTLINEKHFVQKWCQLGEGKLSFSADKSGVVKDVILLQKVYSIQIIHDVKQSSDSENIYFMEISASCKDKPHLVGSPGSTERRIWMQKLLQSMTNVFPSILTADYTRAGWCFLKAGISGIWKAAWILLQRRTLYYNLSSDKISKIDLRKARCIVLQENINDDVGVSEPGPIMLVDTPDQTLYLQMDTIRETKNWKRVIKSSAVENGPTLEDQQLTKDGVPTIVDKCINFVYAHGSMSEGIYRRSGGNTNITNLLTAFQKDAWAVQLSRQEYTEFEVASVLKRFFRNLPEPLLTTQLHVLLCSASGLSCTVEDKVSRYRTLLEKLPPVNYVTLRRLISHLHFIHQQREKNLMPVENLAAIWGPTLMHVSTGNEANWSKRESEVICDLISMYPKLFSVDEEELIKEQRMLEVLEKYHNSHQIPKPSGDIKVWVYITSKESGNCFNVSVGPQRDAGDVCQELCYKMNVYGHELCLMESVLNGALIRPLHHSEKVLDTVLRWGYWDDADCKENCLILVFNTIFRDIAAIAKPPIAQCGPLKFADTKSKAFKSYIFEFSQAKLVYYKDKNGSVKLGEWKIEDLVWYIGHEPKRNPHTRWSITFINKNNKPKRSKENPYFGWTLAGTTRDEQLKWMAAFLIGEFAHLDLLPKPQMDFLK